MQEVARVLKPGGTVVLSTSDRCFPTKAVSTWLRTNDLEHILIYGSYIHHTRCFDPRECLDLAKADRWWRLARGAAPAVSALVSVVMTDAVGGRGMVRLVGIALIAGCANCA